MERRVVIAMSGGVDSSVAAYLLKEQGYDVIGVFMKNWHDSSVTISGECPWEEDSRDAMLVAQKLKIPFRVVDFSKEYKDKIVDYMFREYQKGKTPNPDIMCNKEIKFDVFLKFVKELKADYLATGHYAIKKEVIIDNKKVYRLLSGKDNNKDQSYFLCQLSQEQLSQVLFPIGKLEKSKVREIAMKALLPTANKKDSQGLCFVGKIKLPDFLKQKLSPIKGDVIEIDNNSDIFYRKSLNIEELSKKINYKRENGKVIGSHKGAFYYTIGQRKGIAIGGREFPLFVLDIDTENNIVYVGQGENHRGLYRRVLFIENENINWIRKDLKINEGEKINFESRIRYRQPLKKSILYRRKEGYYVEFEEDMWAITSGQFIGCYLNNELIVSGEIS